MCVYHVFQNFLYVTFYFHMLFFNKGLKGGVYVGHSD